MLQRLDHEIGIKGSALKWFESYLPDRFQFVNVNNDHSEYSRVTYGVSQGSVLGPILFILFMLPLGDIIRKHSIKFHCYANDTQLYLSIEPDDGNRLINLQDCLKDIRSWMSSNFLLLNSDKTEVIVFGPKHLRDTFSNQIATLDGVTPNSNTTARNLGVIFDQDLSFSSHIKHVTRTAFFHLRSIAKIRNILSQSDAEKLVHAFITSRLDYCNSLLSGCPKTSLKSLPVLAGVSKREHIIPF